MSQQGIGRAQSYTSLSGKSASAVSQPQRWNMPARKMVICLFSLCKTANFAHSILVHIHLCRAAPDNICKKVECLPSSVVRRGLRAQPLHPRQRRAGEEFRGVGQPDEPRGEGAPLQHDWEPGRNYYNYCLYSMTGSLLGTLSCAQFSSEFFRPILLG